MPDDPFGVLLDQNVPYEVAAWMRANLGIAALHVYDTKLAGASDHEVFVFAQSERLMIISYDEDFGDQRSFAIGLHCGIARLRVETTPEACKDSMDRLFGSYELTDLRGRLVIVQANRIRIKP